MPRGSTTPTVQPPLTPAAHGLLLYIRYVALVSEVTHGFVTVERPPHGDALQAVALTDKLSLQV